MSFLIHKGDCIAVIDPRFKAGTAVSFQYGDNKKHYEATVSDGDKWAGIESKFAPRAKFSGRSGANRHYKVVVL